LRAEKRGWQKHAERGNQDEENFVFHNWKWKSSGGLLAVFIIHRFLGAAGAATNRKKF
jgi:hypothetical protein